MKSLIRSFLTHLLVLWVAPQVFGGVFLISGDVRTFATAAFVFTVLHIVVRPLLSLLLLPISLATFGLASWLVHAIVLYILTLVIPQIGINSWSFPGFSYGGIVLPAYDLSFVPTLVSIALFMAFFRAIVEFLVD